MSNPDEIEETLKMLKQFLEEKGFDCRITHNGWNGADWRIAVNAKSLKIDENISVTNQEILIWVNDDLDIHGHARKYRQNSKKEHIANLVDPQSLQKVHSWLIKENAGVKRVYGWQFGVKLENLPVFDDINDL